MALDTKDQIIMRDAFYDALDKWSGKKGGSFGGVGGGKGGDGGVGGGVGVRICCVV